MILPTRGLTREEVLSRMKELASRDARWRDGKTWSLVYFAGDDVLDLLKEAYTMFISENGLSPVAFPSLRHFEAEVLEMTAGILRGGGEAVGTMTSGGTESILMAVKTARDRARAERPEVAQPEMVLPITAHPAFEKASHYFGVKAVHIPIREDLRADVEAARKAVTENTILMVGSAPGYPHGVVDPIEQMAALAAENGILFHTDACLGGFLLPWVRRLGYPVPAFDFSVPGVTSISADLHKYGFTAKGASTVVYRNDSIRRHQFFAYTEWPGGLYGSPSMTGARPGGAIAAAWAVMKYLGEEGYLRIARKIMDTTTRLQDGIRSIPELRILGRPAMSVFAFTSDRINVYALAEAMEARGWKLDRQQLPPSLHMMVTPAHERIVEPFLADLKACVGEVAAAGESPVSGQAAIYGMVASLKDRGPAREIILDFLGELLRRET
ncbi:MAG: aspartate aminotransferase family protein [Nitrospirae bacterium]|nr:aspartate aminotransferase family protein [Nitrospirota bacterium]